MSKSTNTKQEDILATQENVENNHNKNSTLNERKQIPDTPFTIIKINYEDNSSIHFIVMGDYRITEPTETEEEQLEKLEKEKWNIIITLAAIAVKKITENPVIHDIDDTLTTDKKWESPRDRENRTRQKYTPITGGDPLDY